MILHPEAKRHYRHVFKRSPFFDEIRDSYKSAALRLPWMSVDALEDWTSRRHEWFRSEFVLVFWGVFPPFEIPARRKATLALRFTESVGDPELLAECQVENMRAFSRRAKDPDVLICGNPDVADYWSRLCRSVCVAPVGYEPEVLGRPDWDKEKRFKLSFRGSDIGRRLWIREILEATFGPEFLKMELYGSERKAALDATVADLYVGHSEDYAFPGMRLWQVISSSAALISERRNAWPAVPGRHYVSLDPLIKANSKRWLDELAYTLRHQPLLEIARRAHGELSTYTIDRCMEEYLVPATKGLSR